MDIFISYSSDDREAASALSSALTGLGYAVWWDARLVSGEDFASVIDERLRQCQAVIVLWTPAAIASRWVRAEAQLAFQDKKIIPLRGPGLAHDTIPAPYNILHSPQSTDLEAILQALTKLGVAPDAGLKRNDRGQRGPFCDADGLPRLRVIAGGQFVMGSRREEKGRTEAEGPQHKVVIPQAICVGITPVTFAQWDLFAKDSAADAEHPSDMGWGRGARPVLNVSWNDCQKYVAWLKASTGKPYRLPSESEWEYCCRGGRATAFAFGDEITDNQARFSSGKFNELSGTSEVGSYPENTYGLFDMHGNVWEWVEDLWRPNYGSPTPPAGESRRVVRGGAWLDPADKLRSAARLALPPTVRMSAVGFRVCRDLTPNE